MDKERGKRVRRSLRWKYPSIHTEHHSKKYLFGKCPAMMIYMDTGLKN